MLASSHPSRFVYCQLSHFRNRWKVLTPIGSDFYFSPPSYASGWALFSGAIHCGLRDIIAEIERENRTFSVAQPCHNRFWWNFFWSKACTIFSNRFSHFFKIGLRSQVIAPEMFKNVQKSGFSGLAPKLDAQNSRFFLKLSNPPYVLKEKNNHWILYIRWWDRRE